MRRSRREALLEGKTQCNVRKCAAGRKRKKGMTNEIIAVAPHSPQTVHTQTHKQTKKAETKAKWDFRRRQKCTIMVKQSKRKHKKLRADQFSLSDSLQGISLHWQLYSIKWKGTEKERKRERLNQHKSILGGGLGICAAVNLLLLAANCSGYNFPHLPFRCHSKPTDADDGGK